MCSHCVKGHFEACEMGEWITNWDFRNLVVLPTGRRVEHENQVIDDFHAGEDHETLSDTLVVGDVFVVKADDEEMEYWLLRCTARKHKIIEKEVRCPWNTKHIFTRDEVGDMAGTLCSKRS
ncbi:hypothetical protein R1flu_004707 [Riccia fluitans]|uniref:Uncharacterized protein n=1 Tax=Riccia fluitans TaxID=41844 RepID=A0ABD1YR23_9MARC